MPRPRIYKTNADRQAAYRKRLKAGKVVPRPALLNDRADAAVVRSALVRARESA